MKPIASALISFSMLLLVACSNSTSSTSSEIEDLLAEFDRVLNAMDTDAIMSFYADDIVILAPDEAVIEGSDAVRVWTENTIRDFVVDETHFPLETIDQGNVILHRGDARGSLTPRSGEPAILFDNKYIHIYRREPDGSLKMIWGAFNANPPE
jgi:ketosteroid isomerase-like protein